MISSEKLCFEFSHSFIISELFSWLIIHPVLVQTVKDTVSRHVKFKRWRSGNVNISIYSLFYSSEKPGGRNKISVVDQLPIIFHSKANVFLILRRSCWHLFLHMKVNGWPGGATLWKPIKCLFVGRVTRQISGYRTHMSLGKPIVCNNQASYLF